MKKKNYAKFLWLFAIGLTSFLLGLAAPGAQADDYTSTDFILRDPVVTIGGQRSTSTDFELFGGLGQLLGSESTSTNFIQRAGWLYFALVTAPTFLSATAGNTQVALSWATSQAYLGAVVASYAVGQSTSSGGPYTFSDVGNFLSSTRTSLTNGTRYYFVVQARDAAGQNLAQSTEASATPVASAAACGDGSCNSTENCSSCPADCGTCPAAGGGGGGGGGTLAGVTKAIIQGKAYPSRLVNILKDGQFSTSASADSEANFKVELNNITPGIYTFGVWAEDKRGIKSIVFNFTVNVAAGVATTISGIFLPPTIDIDKDVVQKGETLNILGQTAPQSDITIVINSSQEIIKKTTAGNDGLWFHAFDTSPLEEGSHSTRAKAVTADGLLSTFSQTLMFAIGGVSSGGLQNSDINRDNKVNLIDFSILLYNWGKPKNSAADLNRDGKVNLTDFSIMMYRWTG